MRMMNNIIVGFGVWYFSTHKAEEKKTDEINISIPVGDDKDYNY